jgi:hypothetical protein
LDSEGLKKNLNELVAGIDFHLFIIAQWIKFLSVSSILKYWNHGTFSSH